MAQILTTILNTDWYDLAFKTAWQNRHSVNITGGNEYVKYLASAGYLKQSSILPNAGREQFNGRANLDMVLSSASLPILTSLISKQLPRCK